MTYTPSKGITIPLIRRMADLREAGLSCAAIKAVVELDHPDVSLTHDAVRYYLRRYGPACSGPVLHVADGFGPRRA